MIFSLGEVVGGGGGKDVVVVGQTMVVMVLVVVTTTTFTWVCCLAGVARDPATQSAVKSIEVFMFAVGIFLSSFS